MRISVSKPFSSRICLFTRLIFSTISTQRQNVTGSLRERGSFWAELCLPSTERYQEGRGLAVSWLTISREVLVLAQCWSKRVLPLLDRQDTGALDSRRTRNSVVQGGCTPNLGFRS
ncbi:hypothetical protein GCG54_00008226 [Colletotrichum gloeosporioides]|uniref:Uncharacterized protein n=1 Tax=Colletotrichum gloeosporioides TaxID=474922 RepID=A0A8H4FEF1_COLGL|nr:uncharacterized protein GCG54_00008226 [Colletotrichum gloeosporioides]KAF3798771.1 hypothetical protein GCG54_00008226 [Colletotrichum gloeosporioides]